MIGTMQLPDDVSCDAAFNACERALQAPAALSFLQSIGDVGISVCARQTSPAAHVRFETSIALLGSQTWNSNLSFMDMANEVNDLINNILDILRCLQFDTVLTQGLETFPTPKVG